MLGYAVTDSYPLSENDFRSSSAIYLPSGGSIRRFCEIRNALLMLILVNSYLGSINCS